VPDTADIPARKQRPKRKPAVPLSPLAEYETEVAGYTAAGGDETVQRVVSGLSRVSKRLDGFYREQLADLDIQRRDWSVLQSLALNGPDGYLTPSGLAELTGVSPSTMTHRLDLLANRGLVERAVDPENRTRSHVRLSEAGWQLFQRVVVEAEVVESGLLDPLSKKEQRQLADLLERLLKGLGPRTH
jgi:DNA-binding MarR family transcriptional regulator